MFHDVMLTAMAPDVCNVVASGVRVCSVRGPSPLADPKHNLLTMSSSGKSPLIVSVQLVCEEMPEEAALPESWHSAPVPVRKSKRLYIVSVYFKACTYFYMFLPF